MGSDPAGPSTVDLSECGDEEVDADEKWWVTRPVVAPAAVATWRIVAASIPSRAMSANAAAVMAALRCSGSTRGIGWVCQQTAI